VVGSLAARVLQDMEKIIGQGPAIKGLAAAENLLLVGERRRVLNVRETGIRLRARCS